MDREEDYNIEVSAIKDIAVTLQRDMIDKIIKKHRQQTTKL